MCGENEQKQIVIYYNQWSNNVDERPHRNGLYLSRGQCNVTPTCPVGKIAVVIEDLPILLRTLQQRLPILFSGPDDSRNCPVSWRNSTPRNSTPSNTWFLGPMRISPKWHLDRFSSFADTDRQTTLRGTSVITGRI